MPSVVGYTGKDAAANLNFYAPQFFAVGANTTDINAIKLSGDGVGYGDSMQIVGPLGSAAAVYLYWDPVKLEMGDGEAYWGDDELNPVLISFDAGDGIAIDNANDLAFNIDNAGEVPMADVSFSAGANLNWSGNPFPAPISINAIKLIGDGVGYGDSMQIVGPLGSAAAVYLYWDPVKLEMGDGEAYWGDDELNPVSVTLNPGDGFAIDNANNLEFTVKILCPYKK